MTPEEFNISIEKLAISLNANLPTINEKMALDVTALIKDRIINTGINYDGAKLGNYSTKEIPVFFKKNGKLVAPFSEPLNGSGEKYFLSVIKENKERRKKGEDPRGISYKQWREANNRPTNFINLTFSGQTLKDVGVKKQIVSGARVITDVGAKNTKNRKGGVTTDQVLSGLSERYGNFLQPNKKEIDLLGNILRDKLIKIQNDAFRK